jgi:hypothetical protein
MSSPDPLVRASKKTMTMMRRRIGAATRPGRVTHKTPSRRGFSRPTEITRAWAPCLTHHSIVGGFCGVSILSSKFDAIIVIANIASVADSMNQTKTISLAKQTVRTLDYFQSPQALRPLGQHRILLYLMILPAAITPFLNFTSRVSPLFVVEEFSRMIRFPHWGEEMCLVLLALPFFIGVPTAFWRLRLLFGGNPSQVEKILAVIFSIVCIAMPVAFVTIGLLLNGVSALRGKEAIGISIGPFVSAAALTCDAWFRRRKTLLITRLNVLLNAGFLANGSLCLFAFADFPDSGWWLTLAVCLVMLAEWIIEFVRSLH